MESGSRQGNGRKVLAPLLLLCGVQWLLGGAAAEEERVELHEATPGGRCTKVNIELKAEGLFRPGLPPDQMTADAKLPKPLALDVKSRLIFSERILNGDQADPLKGGKTTARPKAVRWVHQAASAINGDIRPTAGVLRPELSLLVAEQSTEGTVVVVSPSGPMTRSELELVQGLGDPLVLGDLLPRGPVARGAVWKLPDSAIFALTDYDEVKSSTLEAALEQFDESTARIRLKGEVNGSARGGAGRITSEGIATFDRRTSLVDRLELNRTENRQPGPIEAGLEVKSTLTVQRRPAPLAPELADTALVNLPLDISPARQLLQLIGAEGRYNLLHDRRWHLFWDDPKLVVLKRLDKGRVVAHCKLAVGPSVGKGKHQDPGQFRDDIRRSLKEHFVQFLGAGEVDGDPLGGFRYKVGVQGREGELGVLWNYFLVASPEGDQLLATFTLAEQDAHAFDDQDLKLISTLQWAPPATARKP
jgi:hypothetical protein